MLEDLQIRNYAPGTIAAYIRNVAEFAKHFGKSPDLLGTEQIREYQLYLVNEKKVALSSYILAVCALRFLYCNTLHVPVTVDRIPLPRYGKKLPMILSPAEVKLLLEAPKDLTSKTLLSTMYAAGIRISEVAHLHVPDIDSQRGVIWIRNGKGGKDRQGLLPPKLWSCCALTSAGAAPKTGYSLAGNPGGQSHADSFIKPVDRPCSTPAFPNPFIRTPFDMPLPLTCWMRA
jgi:site-specific recombinase XerD